MTQEVPVECFVYNPPLQTEIEKNNTFNQMLYLKVLLCFFLQSFELCLVVCGLADSFNQDCCHASRSNIFIMLKVIADFDYKWFSYFFNSIIFMVHAEQKKGRV